MYMKIDGVNYYVTVEGNGPPLLLLHGFTGSTATWSELVKKWQKNRTCISVDIIGHGKTDAPQTGSLYQMEVVVQNLQEILEKLDLDQVDVLGYSMGGRLALAFAATFPDYVRKLILESASPGLADTAEKIERKKADKDLATFILEKGIVSFVDYWETIPLFASQQQLSIEKKESLRKERLNNSRTGLANSLIYMGTGTQQSYWGKLANLPMDVLFIVGARDQKFFLLAKKMNALVKKGEIITVPDCGHAIHVENCEIFDTIVSEFLKK